VGMEGCVKSAFRYWLLAKPAGERFVVAIGCVLASSWARRTQVSANGRWLPFVCSPRNRRISGRNCISLLAASAISCQLSDLHRNTRSAWGTAWFYCGVVHGPVPKVAVWFNSKLVCGAPSPTDTCCWLRGRNLSWLACRSSYEQRPPQSVGVEARRLSA
jgi:hypothetical protein